MSDVEPSLELCVQFSEDGKHIRKWSRFPFEGCERLYSHATPNPMIEFVQGIANLSGHELDAHASIELRDLARATLEASA